MRNIDLAWVRTGMMVGLLVGSVGLAVTFGGDERTADAGLIKAQPETVLADRTVVLPTPTAGQRDSEDRDQAVDESASEHIASKPSPSGDKSVASARAATRVQVAATPTPTSTLVSTVSPTPIHICIGCEPWWNAEDAFVGQWSMDYASGILHVRFNKPLKPDSATAEALSRLPIPSNNSGTVSLQGRWIPAHGACHTVTCDFRFGQDVTDWDVSARITSYLGETISWHN